MIAYTDDYVLIGNGLIMAFTELTTLLTKLGLPMKTDKGLPQSQPLSALALINIASKTLSSN